jgi:uncharacterized protein
MKCPNDSTTLVMSERAGVEIDYCPECRGVWLDRGELDKIIDRAGPTPTSAAAPAAPAPAAPYGQPSGVPYQEPYRDQYRDRGYNQGYRPKKKENWLSDLFD